MVNDSLLLALYKTRDLQARMLNLLLILEKPSSANFKGHAIQVDTSARLPVLSKNISMTITSIIMFQGDAW